MISVEEATKIILENLPKVAVEEIHLLQAFGRILAEEVVASRDYPPFDRVTMDGIGISFKSWEQGQRNFKITGTQAAGMAPLTLENQADCLEVMTGAVTPIGVDCVIPVEMIKVENGSANVEFSEQISQGWNIHTKGSDCLSGTPLVSSGTFLNGNAIAVAASEGKEKIKVLKKLKVAVISSGDELVNISENPLPWQIRRSNSYAIAAELDKMKMAEVSFFHLVDNLSAIKEKLAAILAEFDLLIISGAVSQGKFDFMPVALAELKVKNLFHHVAQRPGKPFWFGVTEDKKPVYALPGNPVSAITTFRRYIKPAILKAFGQKEIQYKVRLKEDFKFSKKLTYFLPVTTNFNGAVFEAAPLKINGSGDFSTLVQSDGFVELPAEENFFPKGYEANYFPWNGI